MLHFSHMSTFLPISREQYVVIAANAGFQAMAAWGMTPEVMRAKSIALCGSEHKARASLTQFFADELAQTKVPPFAKFN